MKRVYFPVVSELGQRERRILRFGQAFVQLIQRFFLPYDAYERHVVACRLLEEELGANPKGICVLDVGGRVGLLERFTSYHVISVNVDGSGHLAGSGFALPFSDASFDAVVTIDTLEHMSHDSRLPFLQECWRVAQRTIIVAAPCGSEGHAAFENRLASLYRTRFGEAHVYLGEHIKYSLPDTEELDQLADDLQIARSRRLYAGDYVWQGKQFERMILWGQRKGLLARIIRNSYFVASLALFHPVRLRDRPAATTNRFYWVMEKDG
jgi:SAM-dependent methyltransferase